MFGRAGRPQFDTQGHVFAVAHDDDVKINKWRKKYEQIDPRSKDPEDHADAQGPGAQETQPPQDRAVLGGGQFRTLIEAGPAKLYSRGMIPYSVMIFLLTAPARCTRCATSSTSASPGVG
jgi:hypothetical protein